MTEAPDGSIPLLRRTLVAGSAITLTGAAPAAGENGLSDPFLGKAIEIAIVTRDVVRTMAGLWTLGIGPWRVYTFTPENTYDQTYRGEASPFALRVCFADHGGVIWELMQPLSGRTIFSDFLSAHGEGIHHIAFDCNSIPFADRMQGFARRGYQLVQSGSWMGKNNFAFFETEAAMTTCIETYEFPANWEYPTPETWFPPRS